MNIIPAILTNDRGLVVEQLVTIRDCRQFERVQIDFVDGEFFSNLTIKPEDVDLSPFLPLLFDAHLMVTQNNIGSWSRMAEKARYDRIIPQVESISNPEKFSGLALDIHSPVDVIMPYLAQLGVVNVMSVEPGLGGQEFVNEAVKHIKELTRIRKMNGLNFQICVDGGVELIHLPFLEQWGADEVAVGVERVLSWY